MNCWSTAAGKTSAGSPPSSGTANFQRMILLRYAPYTGRISPLGVITKSPFFRCWLRSHPVHCRFCLRGIRRRAAPAADKPLSSSLLFLVRYMSVSIVLSTLLQSAIVRFDVQQGATYTYAVGCECSNGSDSAGMDSTLAVLPSAMVSETFDSHNGDERITGRGSVTYFRLTRTRLPVRMRAPTRRRIWRLIASLCCLSRCRIHFLNWLARETILIGSGRLAV